MITEKYLSHLIYIHDPMGTCCQENKFMEDEYDSEARHIVHLLSLGVPFKTAFHDVFSFFFMIGCMIPHADALAKIEAQYYNFVSKYSL